MIILGIESSCDDTAAAVVSYGQKILSSVISSQVDIHNMYGGVVPELASRKHIESISMVVDKAITNAGISIKDIDGVAATMGPGLIGSLLVGFTFAKAFSYANNLPFSGVDHLKGHINSLFLDNNPPLFPFVALLVSGGHTALYYVKDHIDIKLLGQTRDDAAGEAYDKVSKMLGLGYPGGRVIDELAEKGDKEKIFFSRPYLDKKAFDFSFSGIKTAVNRYIQTHNESYRENISHIAAGFQEAVVDVLSLKLINAAKKTGCDKIAIVGGVAANKRLRDKTLKQAKKERLSLYLPSFDLCGDNAAMIAATGFHCFKQKHRLVSLDSDVYSRSVFNIF